MAVNTSTTLGTSATVTAAEFRAYCSMLADVLQSGGVIKTTDTGQIDLTTVNFPGSNISAGYEIRKFSDALQSTAPVFIRIEYWRGSNAALIQFKFIVGTGSDGAGNITGTKFTGAVFSANGTGTSTSTVFVSASTNRFAWIHSTTGGAGNGGAFGFERTVDSSKAVTSEGVLHIVLGSAITQQLIMLSGTQPATETTNACFPPTQQSTGLHSDGKVAVYPYFFYGIGYTTIPGTNFVGCWNGDFTQYVQYTVNVLGVNQNMVRGPGSGSFQNIIARGGPTTSAFIAMMRYD